MAALCKSGEEAETEIVRHGWTVGKTLGEGAFGLVKQVTRKKDGVVAACKIMSRPTTAAERESIELESKIMVSCNHDYIVKCYEMASTHHFEFLWLEIMEGGELFDKIVELGSFTEAMASEVVASSLAHLTTCTARGLCIVT